MEVLMAQIEDIEGIGPQYAEKLKGAGISTVEKLLETGDTSKGRDELATKTGINSKSILTWVDHADLFRIKGVAGQFSELLEAAAVGTCLNWRNEMPKICKQQWRKPMMKKMAKTTPSLTQVTNWIAEAKTLPKMVNY
jgi:Domain of unknown function (DUF4332)